jgi:hypothetical protein
VRGALASAWPMGGSGEGAWDFCFFFNFEIPFLFLIAAYIYQKYNKFKENKEYLILKE